MKRLLAVFVTVLSLVGTACGDSDDQNPALEPPAEQGAHNAADVAFAQGMIPHHEQAIEMSDMALAQAASPKVKDLAVRIKNAQAPEIEKMRAWLQAWGEPITSMHGGHGGQGMIAAHGMMSDADMGHLRAASGQAFDRLFLEGMIRHHEGAVTMSKEEQTNGKFPDAKELAGQIIKAQEAEISEMRGLLAELR